MQTNRTLTQWNKAEFGEWSPGGSSGPLPLPSEVNGPVELPTAEDYQMYAEQTKEAYQKGLWQMPHRYNLSQCPKCYVQLPLSGHCDFC